MIGGTLAELLARSPRVLPPVTYHRQHWYPVEGIPSHYPYGRWPSVTTVLSATVPKPALVPWAKGVALGNMRMVLLETDLGATVLAGKFDPEWVDRLIEAARRRPDEVRDEAADFGTRTHQAISAWVKGGPEPEEGSELRPPFVAFRAWLSDGRWGIVASELPVFHLEEGYAGTIDLLLKSSENDEWAVLDIKTSKGIYPEMGLQVAAYGAAVQEMLGLSAKTMEGFVLRLPKAAPEAGEPPFELRQVGSMAAVFQGFHACMELWKVLREEMWAP